MPTRYRLILGALGVAAVAGPVAAARAADLWALLVGVLLAVVFSAVLLMTARIQVDSQGLRIRVAGVMGTYIHYREMTAISAGPVTGLRYGMGLRILPDGIGYLVGGPSVRIRCRSGDVLVSCNSPDRLLAAVAPHLPGTPVAPRLPGTGAAERGQSGGPHG